VYYISDPLNIHIASEFREGKMHSEDATVLQLQFNEVELPLTNFHHKSIHNDLTAAELMRAPCRKLNSDVHKLIVSIWSKQEL
jgi:hypothetical protein